MKKEKILHIVNRLSLGGTQKALQIFATAQMQHAYQVFVVGFFAGGERTSLFEELGIDVFLPRGDVDTLMAYIQQKKIDVIHWHGFPYGDREAVQACKKILKFSRDNGIYIIETSPFSIYDRELDELTDIKLCVSHTSLEKLFYKYPMIDQSSQRYGVLYNPIDTSSLTRYILSDSDRRERRRDLNIRDNDCVIGKVGRANLWKWDDMMIDVALLLRSRKENFRFLVRAIPEIKKSKIQRLGIADMFIYLGETVDEREIACTYQLMDIMLHTSRIGESFGMTMVEGMFFGLPILTHSTDFRDFTLFDRDNSQGEIVHDTENGYICDTPLAMFQKILTLTEDVHIMKDMMSNNRRYVEDNFSIEVLFLQLDELIRTRKLPISMQYNPHICSKNVVKKTSFARLFSINLKALYEKYYYHC